MKKAAAFASALVLLFVLFASHEGILRMRQPENRSEALLSASKAVFHLPASLIAIEDEAFEGTAAEVIILSNVAAEIGNRAFADSDQLKLVYVPASVQSIGEEILSGSVKAALVGERGSYAAAWAQEKGYGFTSIDVYILRAELERDQTVPQASKRMNVICLSPQNGVADAHAVSTGRTQGDLKAARFTGRAAMNVQDRYFP